MKIRILAGLLLLAAIGCSDSVGATADPAIGGYLLTKVNGKTLPASVTASGDITSSTAIDGSIFLDRDGSYTGIVEFRIVRGTVTTIEPYGIADGIWHRSSDTVLVLTPRSGGAVNAQVTTTADLLTIVTQGLAYQYARR